MKIEDCGKPRSEWERLIDEWVFSERDRRILKLRLLDGLTFEALAEAVGMFVRQVKNIVYRRERQLYKHV
jgi:DNA-directed RNA polymerase specialized sigma24 family protein